jgi:hypothetical protein
MANVHFIAQALSSITARRPSLNTSRSSSSDAESSRAHASLAASATSAWFSAQGPCMLSTRNSSSAVSECTSDSRSRRRSSSEEQMPDTASATLWTML